jgi:hypothetical protein
LACEPRSWSRSSPVYSPRSRSSTRSGELLDRRGALASRSASRSAPSCVVIWDGPWSRVRL